MNFYKLNDVLKNEPAYRMKQVYRFVYVNLISNWNEASGLPANLRDILNKECSLEIKTK